VPQVAALVGPADTCSHAFVRGYLDLLRCPQTIAALRGEHARAEKATINKWLATVGSGFGATALD
jgi:hypothetical protein